LTGLVNLNRPDDGSPHKIQIILVDLVTGLYAFHNILMTLLLRGRGATGSRRIEMPLMHTAAWLQATRLGEYILADGNPPIENASPVGVFEASDGLITVVALRDAQWRRLCKVVDREDLPEDPRYLTIPLRLEHDVELKAELRPIFKTRTVAEWSRLLTESDILHQKVLDYGEFLAHPQLAHMKLLFDNDHPGLGRFPLVAPLGAAPLTPDDPRRVAPRLGQHSREILAEMGFDGAGIEALIAAEIVMTDDAEAAAEA
ncbi:MAG: CoA transferase, partial [Alphaproteobacteria bacterium]